MSEETRKVCLFKRAKKPQNRGQRRRHESSDSNKSSNSSASENEESVVVRTERSKRGGLTQSSAGFKLKKKWKQNEESTSESDAENPQLSMVYKGTYIHTLRPKIVSAPLIL